MFTPIPGLSIAMLRSTHTLVAALASCFASLAAPAQAQKFSAVYSLEGASTTVSDSSGNGNDGVVVLATATQGLPSGCAATGGLDFALSASRVEIPDDPTLRPSEAFTLEAWIRAEPSAGIRVAIGKQVGLGADSYVMYLANDGVVVISVDSGPGLPTAVAGPDIDDGDWHHVAAVWDGVSLRLHVDGQLAGTTAFAGPIAYDGNPLTLGNDLNGVSWFEALRGDLDEVRLRPAALSDAEVRAEYLAYGPAATFVRNGSGSNPTGYAAVSRPLIGTAWESQVQLPDSPGALSVVAVGLPAPVPVPTALGEVLCAVPLPILDVATGAHSLVVPDDCTLAGVVLCAQGVVVDGPTIELQNALDVHLGTF